MYRSEAYKAFIRKHPCCMCSGLNAEAHHEALNQGGMGIKAPDSHCVPLCRDCHALHDHIGTKTFWRRTDIKMLIIRYLTEYLEVSNGMDKR